MALELNGEDTLDTSQLLSTFDAHRNLEQQLLWRGPFSDYLGIVKENSKAARLSHARVFDMIRVDGMESQGDDKPPRYKFFEEELYGLDGPLSQIVDYFSASAKGLEVRKRILLLMGPVGGGKSTIVSMLKRGLESYTRTEAGAVYGIDGCPMNEEPLHLVPDTLRPEVSKLLKVRIEGDLCPRCRMEVIHEHGGRYEDMPVARFTFSEKERRGIGTFSPSDPKSQDISELTGSIDLSTVGQYGSESDPRAYRFDGELNIANRGMMEFIEMLKSDEKFLYNLLTLSQEQSIKTGRFAMIYADEVLVSHTNESEYNAFVANKRGEALQDRIIQVKVPYNLRLSDEMRIYDKLLRETTTGIAIERAPVDGEVHISPGVLKAAAMFAVLSRLTESKKEGVNLMTKLKLYDGQDVGDKKQKDLRELTEEAAETREGMDGISPRYVINRLSSALVREGAECLNPIDAIRSLRDGLESYPGLSKEKRDEYLKLLGEVRTEYDERAKTDVQKAFIGSFEDNIRTVMDNYIDNIEAFCNKSKVKDPYTDEEVEPDERLMREIEDQIGVTEGQKAGFRQEIVAVMMSKLRRGGKFDYTSHERLREGLEKKLFADMKDMVKVTTSTKTPDADQQKRIDDVQSALIKDRGYCTCCSSELLKYVGTLLNR